MTIKKDKRIKLTDKQKKGIIADYIECGNYSEVARKWNKNPSTIKRLCDSGYDKNLQKKAKEKHEENTKDILEYMDSKKEDTQRVLGKLLHGIEVKADELDMLTDIKGLATAYGIILDKQLKILELQRGTANNEQLNKVQELLSKLDEEAKR